MHVHPDLLLKLLLGKLAHFQMDLDHRQNPVLVLELLPLVLLLPHLSLLGFDLVLELLMLLSSSLYLLLLHQNHLNKPPHLSCNFVQQLVHSVSIWIFTICIFTWNNWAYCC